MATKKNSTAARRSDRRSIPTSRAQQYINDRDHHRPTFPSLNDEIQVKWVVNNRSVWWPASVVSVQSPSVRSQKCAGTILYHKFEQYEAVLNSVVFSVSSERHRFVSSTDSGSDEIDSSSSWVYSDEITKDSDVGSDDDYKDENREKSLNQDRKRNNRTSRNSGSKLSLRRCSQQDLKITTPIRKRLSTGKEQVISGAQAGPSSAVPNESASQGDITKVSNDEVVPKDPSSTMPARPFSIPTKSNAVANFENHTTQIDVRLQAIERQLQHAGPVKSPSTISSSTNSVLSSLRWAFLRALEKPLKLSHHPSLSQHGLARQELTVSTSCDYYSFREIASMLATEHKFAAEEPEKSRVAFSPALCTIQSGSSAADNLNVLFTCLADVTSFLRIRDDNDFEAILTKEVLTNTSNLLRILGTFTITTTTESENGEPGRTITTVHETSTNSKSTISVSVSSESVSTIRLFVGTSPVNHKVIPKNEPKLTDRKESDCSEYRSTIFEQDCKHFCLNKKCYRTQWKTKHITCDPSVNSTFHLDGTIETEELNNYFLLNWSRQPAPSAVKWTRDIQDVGNNTPGQLRLTVPTIFFTSKRNVECLVSMFDRHIETFMKMRAQIHSTSTFR